MLNVLCACEESQAVCIALRELGHNAFSCDIQDCSGGHPEWHIKADVSHFLVPALLWTPAETYENGFQFDTCDGKYHLIRGDWDLIIAFPPCTYLTKVSAPCMVKDGVIQEDRYQKMLVARNFFLQILDGATCPHIAVENPTPLALAALPPYDQAIQPWMFGHSYKKRTCLWLRGLPPLMPTLLVYDDLVPWCSSTKGGKVSGSFMRSKTFPGIAAAMAAQWADYIETRKKGGCFN